MTATVPLSIERDGLYAVIHGGHPYKTALQSVGAKWRADGTYRLPLTVANMNALVRAGVPLDHYEPDISADPWLVDVLLPPDPTWHPHWDDLYSYQRDAVDFLMQNPYPGALLALSPGLGKTAVSIVAAEMVNARSVLTICPRVLIEVWRSERAKWATCPWNDSKQNVIMPWQVTNYDQVVRHPDAYEIDWDIVIIDESILAKNRTTKRWKALKKLRRRAQRMWLLSGSPISRYVDDLYAQLYLCFPEGFSSYWRFVEQYCFVESNVWGGRDVTGSRPWATSAEFKDLMFVRHQSDVLPDLPEYIHQIVEVPLSRPQQERYRKAVDDMIIDLDGAEMPVTTKIALLTRLQQIVAHPLSIDPTYVDGSAKEDAVAELVESNAVEVPLLVWVWFRAEGESMARRLHAMGKRVGLIMGDTPDSDAVIQRFKDGEIDCLVASILTGRYGLTLTAARTVIYNTLSFDADAYVQSLARVKRIGLTHRPHVIRLVAPGTVDGLVTRNLEGKLPSIANVSNADLAGMLRAL